MCLRAAYGRSDLADELFGECLDRVDGCFRTWDIEHPSQRSLNGHVKNSLRLYCFKWMRARYIKQSRTQPLCVDVDATDETHGNLDVADEVYYIMARLSALDAKILHMYTVDGLTFIEIGEALGFSKSTARNYFNQALARAQEIAKHGNC